MATLTQTTAPNTFPKTAGIALTYPNGSKNDISQFNFPFDSNSPAQTHQMSDDPSRKRLSKATTDYGVPADQGQAELDRVKTQESRRRTQYYEEQFAYKEDGGTARERITRASPVVAELRTNVIIKDEYTLTTDLSYHLSTRYQRSESSIMITVNHSACLLLGGSFEPAYVLTITALPSQVQPATNKRNAALIQSFMSDVLSVSADRGIVRFQAIEEYNLATNGRTMLGEIERLEKLQPETRPDAVKREKSKIGGRKSFSMKKEKETTSRRNSVKSTHTVNGTDSSRTTTSLPKPQYDSGISMNENPFSSPKLNASGPPASTPPQHSDNSPSSKDLPTLATKLPYLPPPPPIPQNKETTKMGKRKSFISMFKR
ncbi:hypothetical protein LTS18_011882 [Coniosporium uncinatum]|uniref:Uncharacterized protein n=1 Tax=Coniosporium uncinatum TaxID=93489 RepID=A0ACC3DCV8_9PEZI|nr:hypothetical protein LTS18_011882 [Coniosporium uncinatum]